MAPWLPAKCQQEGLLKACRDHVPGCKKPNLPACPVCAWVTITPLELCRCRRSLSTEALENKGADTGTACWDCFAAAGPPQNHVCYVAWATVEYMPYIYIQTRMLCTYNLYICTCYTSSVYTYAWRSLGCL